MTEFPAQDFQDFDFDIVGGCKVRVAAFRHERNQFLRGANIATDAEPRAGSDDGNGLAFVVPMEPEGPMARRSLSSSDGNRARDRFIIIDELHTRDAQRPAQYVSGETPAKIGHVDRIILNRTCHGQDRSDRRRALRFRSVR